MVSIQFVDFMVGRIELMMVNTTGRVVCVQFMMVTNQFIMLSSEVVVLGFPAGKHPEFYDQIAGK